MADMRFNTAFGGASPSFVKALHTDRPAPDRAEKLALYGRFIGRWAFEGIVRGQKANGGEIHFGWVLGGRAIQDVWILPETVPRHDAARLRPRPRRLAHSVERPAAARWSFDDISRDRFVWRGERSLDGGATWELEADFNATRVA